MVFLHLLLKHHHDDHTGVTENSRGKAEPCPQTWTGRKGWAREPPLCSTEEARIRGCADREEAGSCRELWKGLGFRDTGASWAGDHSGLEAKCEVLQGSGPPPPHLQQRMGCERLQPERRTGPM